MALFNYKPPRSRDQTNAIVKLSAELGKIGSNINQIAYRYNRSDGRPSGNIEGALDAATTRVTGMAGRRHEGARSRKAPQAEG